MPEPTKHLHSSCTGAILRSATVARCDDERSVKRLADEPFPRKMACREPPYYPLSPLASFATHPNFQHQLGAPAELLLVTHPAHCTRIRD